MSARVIPVAIFWGSSLSSLRSSESFTDVLRSLRRGLDRDAVADPVRALDDDGLAGRHAREDLDHPRAGTQPDLHRLRLRLPALDGIRDEAPLAGLDRALGHDQGALLGRRGERDLGEEAGLQHPRVLDPGEDLDLARGGI